MVSDNNTGQDSPQHLDTPGAVAFDAAYAAPALEELRKAVTGNGVKPENIRLENITGATLNFTAVTILKIQPRISEKTTLGRITGPEKVDNAKSMRDAIENHKRESVQNFANITRIRDTILSRDDRGFALVNARINLDFLRKDFVYFESCNACRAKGTLLCQRCDGKGYEICPRCNGNGVDFCPVCNGNGTIQMQDGKHQSCHRCRGERKIVCSLCQQRRKIQCGVCKTKGSTTCAQCNGQGWNSIISIVEIEAIVAFDYSRDDVPERIRMQIEELGAALAQYASITPIAPAQETRSEDIKITYQVSLPYADAVFAFNGKKIDALLLGNNGKICNAPNFLEDLIRPGIEKLEAAAQGRGATDSLLREALKYKTLRHAIIGAAKYSKGKAAKAVLHNTPLGLSPSMAQHLVTQAHAAIENLTGKSRMTGIIAGLILAAVLCAAYFLTPLRGLLAAQIPDKNLHIAVDALGVAVAVGFGIALSAHWKNRAKKSSLQSLLGHMKQAKK